MHYDRGTQLPWRIALDPLLSFRPADSSGEGGRLSDLLLIKERVRVEVRFDNLVVGEAVLRVTFQMERDEPARREFRLEGADRDEELVFRRRKVGPALAVLARFPRAVWAGTGVPVRFSPPLEPLTVGIQPAPGGRTLVRAMLPAGAVDSAYGRARAVGEDPSWIWSGTSLLPVTARLPASVLDLLIEGIVIPEGDRDSFLRDYLPALRQSGLELSINGRLVPSNLTPPETFLCLAEDSRGLWVTFLIRYGRRELPPAAAVPRDGRGVWESRAMSARPGRGRRSGRQPDEPDPGLDLDDLLIRDAEHERHIVEIVEELHREVSADLTRARDAGRTAVSLSRDKALARGSIVLFDAATLLLTGQVALDFLYNELPRLKRSFTVRGEDELKTYHISREVGRVSLRVGIKGKRIDLTGTLESKDGAIGVGSIVRSLAAGSSYVRLDSGKIARLPSDWLQMDAWARLAQELPRESRRRRSESSLDLPLHMIGWIIECGELTGSLHETEDWIRFKNQLLDFKGIDVVPIPAGLGTTLRTYQAQCLNWLYFLHENHLGGILADDMGLGKTVQALALLLHLRNQGTRAPSLIVCPTSVLENWRRESERFCPELKAGTYHGRDRHRLLETIDDYQVILTTYGVLRRDLKPLRKIRFLYVILDESQNIKSLTTATTLSAFNLNATNRLCLTGTPVENSPLELYSQINFLMPGILGSVRRFRRSFLEGDALTRKDRVETLRNRVKPFLLRRTKEQVTPELPEKQLIQLTCTMDPATARVYRQVLALSRDEVFAAVRSRGMGQSHLTILQALLRLRQICCHPALLAHLDPAMAALPSAKLELLNEILDSVVSEGHRVLVFSQFTSMLALIRPRLEAQGVPYLYLDGKTRNRQELVDRFNTTEAEPVFLMSLKAGGTGLNLTGADYVIHYDPWWNPAVMDQATARSHRIGQTRKVIAYNLIVKDSIEEKVLALADRKREIARELVPTDVEFGKMLSRNDLEELFAPLP